MNWEDEKVLELIKELGEEEKIFKNLKRSWKQEKAFKVDKPYIQEDEKGFITCEQWEITGVYELEL